MLGDHGWVRKRSAYEGSAKIPMFFTLPAKLMRERGFASGIDAPDVVELMDVMPTILELLGLDVPECVDGKSLLPAMRKESLNREYIHGECARMETIGSGMQFLTDGKRKYIWYPGLGLEQFFDLEKDPGELHNLASDPVRADALPVWRERVIRELDGRGEGFVKGGRLAKLDGPTQLCADKLMMSAGKPDKGISMGFF
jgi:arylsulfatase A-like enzyme